MIFKGDDQDHSVTMDCQAQLMELVGCAKRLKDGRTSIQHLRHGPLRPQSGYAKILSSQTIYSCMNAVEANRALVEAGEVRVRVPDRPEPERGVGQCRDVHIQQLPDRRNAFDPVEQ